MGGLFGLSVFRRKVKAAKVLTSSEMVKLKVKDDIQASKYLTDDNAAFQATTECLEIVVMGNLPIFNEIKDQSSEGSHGYCEKLQMMDMVLGGMYREQRSTLQCNDTADVEAPKQIGDSSDPAFAFSHGVEEVSVSADETVSGSSNECKGFLVQEDGQLVKAPQLIRDSSDPAFAFSHGAEEVSVSPDETVSGSSNDCKGFLVEEGRRLVKDLQGKYSYSTNTGCHKDSHCHVEEWINNLHLVDDDDMVHQETEISENMVHQHQVAEMSWPPSSQSTSTFPKFADFSGTGLRQVPALGMFKCLKILNLSANQIARVPPGCLPRSLHSLDLSRNRISSIEGLRELTRLRVLNMSHNRISRVGPGLANCSLIKELYLVENKIAEVEGLHRLLKLAVLDLSFNKLATLRAVGQIAANYKSLLALNLLGNPVFTNVGEEQLKKYVTSLTPQLTFLNKNPIKAVPARAAAVDSVARAALGTAPRAGKSSGARARTGAETVTPHKRSYGKATERQFGSGSDPSRSARAHKQQGQQHFYGHHERNHHKHNYSVGEHVGENDKLHGYNYKSPLLE